MPDLLESNPRAEKPELLLLQVGLPASDFVFGKPFATEQKENTVRLWFGHDGKAWPPSLCLLYGQDSPSELCFFSEYVCSSWVSGVK